MEALGVLIGGAVGLLVYCGVSAYFVPRPKAPPVVRYGILRGVYVKEPEA